MKKHLKLSVPLWLGCLLSILLSACAPPPEQAAQNRAELAKAEDGLAQCRVLVTQKYFEDNWHSCQIFLEKDKDCDLFPEQKEGCLAFTNTIGYSEKRLHCQSLAQIVDTCKTLVEEKFYSRMTAIKNFITRKSEENWVERAKTVDSDILIGVVRSGYGGKSSLLHGVELAIEEVNRQGGVLGRKLNIIDEKSDMNLERSREIAEKMRDDPRIRAVIGQQFSVNTIPVTYVYENSQIVYIATSAIMRNVIRYGNRFTFRLLPNSDDFAKALVEFCLQQKHQRLALLYSRDSYNEELAYAFRDYAVAKGLNIVFEKSFFAKQTDFADISADMKELDIEAVFLSALADTAVHTVKDMHAMGIKATVIGSDALDSDEFAEVVGNAGNGIVVPSIYNPFSKKSKNASFVNAFRNTYGYNPDTWAAQGYDAVKLLAYAMDKEVNSSIPSNVATGLRYMPPQQAASGEFVFESDGELKNKPIYFKELQNGQFILFKDSKQEAEQSQNIEIINDWIFRQPEKPSESTEAMSVL